MKLFKSWSIVDGFQGHDQVRIDWFPQRSHPETMTVTFPIIAYEEVVADYHTLDNKQKQRAENRVNFLFSESEVIELRQYLNMHKNTELKVKEIDFPRKGNEFEDIAREDDVVDGKPHYYHLFLEPNYNLSLNIIGYYNLKGCPATKQEGSWACDEKPEPRSTFSRDDCLKFLQTITEPIIDYVPAGGFGGGHGPRDITYILSKDGLYYFYDGYFDGPFTLTKEGIEQAEKIIIDGLEQALIDEDINNPAPSLEDLLFHFGGKTIVEMVKAGCEPGKDYFRYPTANAGDGRYFDNLNSVNRTFVADILANYESISWTPWGEFEDSVLESWCKWVKEADKERSRNRP